MQGKTVLVTGASGFVGCALAIELSRHNKVYGLARFSSETVKRQLQRAGVSIIQKDVLRGPLGDRPCRFDYVFHELAMLYSCDESPEQAYAVNTDFMGSLMDWCRDASGIVLASTGAVYLPGPHFWNEQGAIAPRNGYAVSKYGGEVLGRFLCKQWSIPTCILRYFNPYGLTGGKITGWARQLALGQEIELDKSDMPVFTPVHITDCVRYTIQAALQCRAPAQVINIGSEEGLSQTKIVSVLGEAMGVEPKYKDVDHNPPAWTADVSLMKSLFGPPRLAIRDGLRTVALDVAAGVSHGGKRS